MISITLDTWKEQVLDSATPVVVDFWQPDCQPCKVLAKQIDILKAQTPTKFVACNIYECTDLAIEYRVLATPTLVVFKQGVEVDRMSNTRFDALRDLVFKWSEG